MAIRFRCDRCNQLLSIGSRKAGTQVNCTCCQASLTVPVASTDRIGNAATESASPAVELTIPVAPAPDPALFARNLLAVATVLTIVLILGAGAMAYAVIGRKVRSAEEEVVQAFEPALPPMAAQIVRPLDSPIDQPVAIEVDQLADPKASTKPAPEGEAAAAVKPATDGVRGIAVAKDFSNDQPQPLLSRSWIKKRISEATDEELRQQLVMVPEVRLDAVPNTSQRLIQTARVSVNKGVDVAAQLLFQRPDLAGLPHRMGMECRTGKESAENLQALSRKLRSHLDAAVPASVPADPRPDPNLLRNRLLAADGKGWAQAEALPALLQLLMAENKNVRLILVELLARIPGKQSSEALARRAVFDLHHEVRSAAAHALFQRPGQDYSGILVEALQYPWAPAAEHAAEAMVALKRRDLVTELIPLLDARGPDEPFYQKVAPNKSVRVVRELVRINHLSNCLLCHPPSFAQTDLVRGLVPAPGRSLGSSPSSYSGPSGTFVRADVTYVKQDFSVPQPVPNADPWPSHQRFDYLVRLRPTPLFWPGAGETWSRPGDSPHRKAVQFALRELTGIDAGPQASGWKYFLQGAPSPAPISVLGAAWSASNFQTENPALAVVEDGVFVRDRGRPRAE
jgi:hypothetical protein